MAELKPKPKQTCRMVVEIAAPDGKRTAYSVRPIASQIAEHRRAYQVRNLSSQDIYHVTQEASGRRSCDCASNEFRGPSCKHTRALNSLGLFLSPREILALNRLEKI